MGVLLPNYQEENVVKGDRVPNYSKVHRGKTGNGTSHGTQSGISYASTGNGMPNGMSNVFHILNDIWKRQRAIQCQYNSNTVPTAPETETSFRTTTPSTPAMQHIQYQYNSSMVYNAVNSNMVTSTVLTTPEMDTSFRTTTPSAPDNAATTAIPVDPVHVHNNTSWSGPPAYCAHVHKSTKQVCRPGESLALRKVQHLPNGRTSVTRLPLMKQDILSHYSSCFEGIGHFPGEPYKFHLKPEHKPARHAPRKVPIHLESAFKEEIKSLVKLGILEEVKEQLIR